MLCGGVGPASEINYAVRDGRSAELNSAAWKVNWIKCKLAQWHITGIGNEMSIKRFFGEREYGNVISFLYIVFSATPRGLFRFG